MNKLKRIPYVLYFILTETLNQSTFFVGNAVLIVLIYGVMTVGGIVAVAVVTLVVVVTVAITLGFRLFDKTYCSELSY